ncbi:MAG: integrase core domain-containing protein [Dissulfurispiraceae bacterium]
MKVFSIAKGFHRLAKHTPTELTNKETNRLRALRLYPDTKDIGLVCRTFDISRATLYRWIQRFNPHGLSSVKEHLRRPKRLRKAQWSYELIIAVKQLRQQYLRWGKDKLIVLLKDQGWETSASTVCRIIGYLKKRGDIVEPRRRAISTKKRQQRSYAVRKPKEYVPVVPGDLVQIDTLDIRPAPGVILKQFTARDVISKWDVIEARYRATARTATEFIDTLHRRMRFSVKAIQVDGYGAFYAEVETACKEKGIALFVLPPRSPKLNGSVERGNRTHTEEFYEVTNCSWLIPELNKQLIRLEHVYNCIRPHRALANKTPLQFLKDNGIIHDHKPLSLSHM